VERRASSATAAGIRWAAALTAAGLALTGCGAGNNAQTSEVETAISGVNVDAGALALRDLQVDFGETGFYPEGGQAPLRVWIGNSGTETVALESVTSPAAERITLATEVIVDEETPGGDTTETPGGESPTETETPTPGGESPSPDEVETPTGGTPTPGGETPTGAASPSPGEATPSLPATETETPQGETPSPGGEQAELIGEPEFTIEIGPASHVRLAPTSGSFLLLEGLKEDVAMGSSVEVTFTFSNGEEVTVPLPMGEPAESASRSYFEDPHEEAAE